MQKWTGAERFELAQAIVAAGDQREVWRVLLRLERGGISREAAIAMVRGQRKTLTYGPNGRIAASCTYFNRTRCG